jgi:hypothetical protein
MSVACEYVGFLCPHSRSRLTRSTNFGKVHELWQCVRGASTDICTCAVRVCVCIYIHAYTVIFTVMRRRIHACHMRRRIHACHMRRRIHVYTVIFTFD